MNATRKAMTRTAPIRTAASIAGVPACSKVRRREVSSLIDAEVSTATGLSPAIADLLFRLARTPGHELKTIDITRSLATTTTRTTRLVDQAEQLGFVQRANHPQDRRAILVRLTDAGLDTAATAGAVALGAAQRHVHDILDQKTTDQLARILRKLRDAAAVSPPS